MEIDMLEASKMTNYMELVFGTLQMNKPKDKANGLMGREPGGLVHQSLTM